MTVGKLLKQKNISVYRLAKNSGLPYSTVMDICSGKAQLGKCSAETVYRLSKELGVTMEALLEGHMAKRIGFALFKSSVCHRLKELGDISFIIHTLEEDAIRAYYERDWFAESFYLLAMLDYISRINDVPLCTRYDDLRQCSLKRTLYPAGILTAAMAAQDESIKERAFREAIPEFLRFNIVENEVRNVI